MLFMLFFILKVKCDPKEKKSVVYGEDNVTNLTCQKWFEKFHFKYLLQKNDLRSRRKMEVDRNQSTACLEDNVTMWNIW